MASLIFFRILSLVFYLYAFVGNSVLCGFDFFSIVSFVAGIGITFLDWWVG